MEQNLRLSFERKAEEYSTELIDYEDDEDSGADYPQDSPEMDADVRMKVSFTFSSHMVFHFILRILASTLSMTKFKFITTETEESATYPGNVPGLVRLVISGQSLIYPSCQKIIQK